jgi:hypothetical protein
MRLSKVLAVAVPGAILSLTALYLTRPTQPGALSPLQKFAVAVHVSGPRTISPEEADRNLRQAPVTVAAARQARSGVARLLTRAARSHRHIALGFGAGDRVDFEDRPKRPGESAHRGRVVYFPGSQPAGDAPISTFQEAAARTAVPEEAARALQFVSQHEGGFDAVNTWDCARFSWGFIQFAGGRGFPLLLAYLKAQEPELFQRYFAQYGVDVLPGRTGNPVPLCVDAKRKVMLFGDKAEQCIGDNPVLVGLFIRAGRDPQIQRAQIEAALNQYVAPALSARSSGVVLSSILRSPKGMAMLIDRKIHEGNCRRLARALEGVRQELGFIDPAYAEGQVLLRALRDTANQGRSAVRQRLQNIYYTPELAGPV